MEKIISERKVIIYTTALIVFAGLVRMLNYSVGFVLFYLAFLPFIIYRISYYYKLQGKPKHQLDKYRLIILVIIIITILLNLIGIQDVEFFLLFLLMIDFLLVINRKS
jgi:hypothetical protein